MIEESVPPAEYQQCRQQDEWKDQHGLRAQKQQQAEHTARENGLRLVGLTGTGGGIIGALAAVGLHTGGNDGRFLWLPGLRELKGTYSVADLRTYASIDHVCVVNGNELAATERVDVGEWVRPVLRNGKSTLYVEEQNHGWHILSKDHIKNLSN